MTTLPPGFVIIDPNFVNMLLLITTSLGITIVIIIIALAISNNRTPSESKHIKTAKVKGLPLLLNVSVGHFADILHANDFIPEGVLEKIKGKGSKKTRLRYQIPKNQNIEEIIVSHKFNPLFTREAFKNLVKLATDKVFLRSARVPILGTVEDKAVAVGLKGLGALSFYDKLEKLGSLKDKISKIRELKLTEKVTLKDPETGKEHEATEVTTFDDVADIFSEFSKKVSTIDFDSIRTHFVDAIFDQTTGESIADRDQNIGRREAGKGMETFKQWLPFIVILLIAGGLALAFIIAAGTL